MLRLLGDEEQACRKFPLFAETTSEPGTQPKWYRQPPAA